jgi:arginine:pyruvate transaminase
VAPRAFCDALLPISESMLFGGQPFIADMTERAVREGSSVAEEMRARFSQRAARLAERIGRETDLVVHCPDAGMFAMVKVSATGMDGRTYALDLLEKAGVAVMPGASFGGADD